MSNTTTASSSVTAADRSRWQRTALELMTDAISKGAKAGLHPLTWQLGVSGCAGQVSTLGLTLDEQERCHREWADLLGWPVSAVGESRYAQEPVDQTWMSPRIVIRVTLFDWDFARGEDDLLGGDAR